MTQEEREQFEQQLRQELEAEHEARVAKAADQREHREVDELALVLARARVEREVREAFFKEKGYRPYENSRGETEWLLPEEYERRMRARKRRSKRGKRPTPQEGLQLGVMGWALVIVGAMGVGFALLRFVLKG